MRATACVDGGTAVEVLSVSSVFWVDPSVFVQFGRSCCSKRCDCDRHDFFLRRHRRGTLYYGLYGLGQPKAGKDF